MGNPLAHASTAGRPWKASIIVRLFARRSDLCSSFHRRLASSGEGLLKSGAARLAGSEHGPDDPCHLIGDRDRGSVEAAPLPKLIDPSIVGIGFIRRRLHDGAGAMDKQASQMPAAAFRDPHQHCSITAGELPRNQSDPGGQMPAVLELRSVADSGNNRRGRLRADAFDPGDTLAGLAGPEHLDLLVKDGNPAIEIAKEIVKLSDRFPGE